MAKDSWGNRLYSEKYDPESNARWAANENTPFKTIPRPMPARRREASVPGDAHTTYTARPQNSTARPRSTTRGASPGIAPAIARTRLTKSDVAARPQNSQTDLSMPASRPSPSLRPAYRRTAASGSATTYPMGTAVLPTLNR